MVTIDAGLYWSLPGPRDFINKIASRISAVRVLAINLPQKIVPGTWEGVRHGLHQAHIDNVIELIIRRGTDIADDVGFHFLGKRVTAAQLAGLTLSARSAVILKAEDPLAYDQCAQYTYDFMRASEHMSGNVHLVTSLHDPQFQSDIHDRDVQIITFDGGLSPDEMEAYVSLRMIGRPGPGSTRLFRAIVSEFAGFDAQFAERLMLLDNSQILAIRDQLGLLLGEEAERWRVDTWLAGIRSHAAREPHVLHDQYLAESGTNTQKEISRSRIARRYWRACVKILTPWLEERKLDVIKHFYPQLRKLVSGPDGKIVIPRANNKTASIEIEELEYNNIVGMSFSNQISANTSKEIMALKVCKCVKPVRDDIAHLRAPDSSLVFSLIHEMDTLLGQ